jgi:uncharacterized protein
VILVDTSGLIAAYDRDDRYHLDTVGVLSRPQLKVLSPFVLAELDYLLSERAGHQTSIRMLEDVERGAFELAQFGATDVSAAVRVIRQYAGLRIGLADASLVVLAERYECHTLLTLDQRHFRTVVARDGAPFRLLPFDNER